ncbi:MAG: hypothetical protein H7Y32_20340, partial [Chloroflexales bacterium]|nr:hypothetical protein [Chloroflexales bacterium]
MADETKVRVRMYRHGLGDCILLTFNADDQPFHMLIDCGLYKTTANSEETMQKVVAQIRDATKPNDQAAKGHLDVVVVTHEHWDHTSGFSQAQQLWENDFEIDALWLAWTEDESIPLARALREERVRGIRELTKFLSNLPPDKREAIMDAQEHQALLALIESFGPMHDPAATTNETTGAGEAINIIKKLARPFYHRPGTTIPCPALPGVRFHVLGPPQNELIFKEGKDSKDGTIYELGFQANVAEALFAGAWQGTDSPALDPRFLPFNPELRVVPPDAEGDDFYKRTYYGGSDDWRTIETDWLRSSAGLALNLAADTNNTSLVLAIELLSSGKVLLFTGDAQVG